MFRKSAVFVFVVLFTLLYLSCENAHMPTQQDAGSPDLNLYLTTLPAGAVLQSATFSIWANIAEPLSVLQSWTILIR